MNGLSRQDRNELLKKWHWSPELDLCQDVWAPRTELRPWPKEIPVPKVDLPPYYQEQAEAYMRAIAARWPFQVRDYLCDPMWLRFCDVWESGSKHWSLQERFKYSMRAI